LLKVYTVVAIYMIFFFCHCSAVKNIRYPALVNSHGYEREVAEPEYMCGRDLAEMNTLNEVGLKPVSLSFLSCEVICRVCGYLSIYASHSYLHVGMTAM